jgi:hypothetical protein
MAYIKWRGRCSLLTIPLDGDSVHGRPTKYQTFHFNGVAMIVDDDILVLGEKRVKIIGTQRMRVAAMGTENHEVSDVDDAHPQSRSHLAKECSGRYNFECHFDTDANEDADYLELAQAQALKGKHSHIRVHAIVDARKFPYRCARNTVLLDIKQNASKFRRDHFTLFASSGLSQTGVGCLLPTIKFT